MSAEPDTAVPPSSDSPRPPRAFTQGVGTVFQFAGVTLFLVMMSVCCGSSLLGKETAERRDLTQIGWHLPGDDAAHPFYSAQRAITLSVTLGVALGIAVASVGLGLQATRRSSAGLAVLITVPAALFYVVQIVFAVVVLRSILLTLGALLLAALLGVLAGLAIAALREMRRQPPPADHEILPADYNIPYSHLHQDPPEVRLQRELDQRRQRLAVQQRELEMLEEKLKRKSGDGH